MKTIKLGTLVRDSVTGFEGIVTARSEFLNGCIRCGVQSRVLKDGIPTESQWFDEPQLVDLGKTYAERTEFKTGGPCPCVPRRAPDAKM